jgi:putative FmdB family regulatory protein
MPIYEYTCKSCGTSFEHLHRRLDDTDKVKCPECGSARTDQTLSLFAVGAASEKSAPSDAPGMCHRCGGPGPCGME